MKHNIKSQIKLLAVASSLLVPSVRAESGPHFERPVTQAPATATAPVSGGPGNGTADLAKTLANPIGALISVPFQSNFDFGGGPAGDGYQFKLNLQPIIPITLNEDWLLISRTILPFVDQQDIFGTSSQTGLAETLQSFFLSPAKPTESGWIWGAGPAMLLPTATDELLGGEKWGAGPTAVALKQQNGWTYGSLASHIWSFAGDSDRADVSASYLQPFVSYTTKTSTTFTLNTESTYDWTKDQWTLPLNLMLQQIVKIGDQPIALTVGARYYADKPDDGPDWGLRFAIIFLFPRS